jgi:hypothetical protein
MKTFSLATLATAVFLGLGGGIFAYRSASHDPVPARKQQLPPASQPPTPQVIIPGVSFRLAPCEDPAVLVGDVCVIKVIEEKPDSEE